MAIGIQEPTQLYHDLMHEWRLPDDLMHGTERMRLRRQEYLPQHPRETDTDYDNRLHQTFLFNVFKRTIRSLRGKVFSNPIVLGDDTPKQFVEWSRNIDLQNRDITAFSFDVFTDSLIFGVGYILVDFPRSSAGANATRADNIMEGARPYFVRIQPQDLIGWQFDYNQTQPRLIQARFRQHIQLPTSEYDSERVERIWLLEPGRVQIWEEQPEMDAQNKFMQIAEYPTTLDEIPLVPIYTMRKGEFEGVPPLEDLAWKNVEHWQSSSDQRHILHVSRVPILFGAGLAQSVTRVDPETGETSKQAAIELGPNAAIFDPDPQARLEYVQHDSSPIEAGRQDLQDIQEQMEALSLVPLLPQRTGNIVATAKVLEEAQANSALAAWALSLRAGLEQAYGFAAKWAGMDTDISVTVPTEFGLGFGQFEEINSILTMRRIGDLSREGLWSGMQRLNVLPDDFDADLENERLREEHVEAEAMKAGTPPPDRTATQGQRDQNAEGLMNPEGLEGQEGQELQQELPGLQRSITRSTPRI